MIFVDSKLYNGTVVAKFIPPATRYAYGWLARFWIPETIARCVQTALYAIYYRADAQTPNPRSTRSCRDRRRLYKVVVIAMFLLTLYQVDCNIQREPNLYRSLGVLHDADYKTARAALRKRAKQYHPDKVKPEAQHLAVDTFIRLRDTVNVIGDDHLRSAYNNYGPLALDCKGECSVNNKHISQAYVQQLSFYVTCIVESVILVRRGKWRWLWCPFVLITVLAVVEAYAELTDPALGIVPHAVASLLKLTRLSDRYLKFELVLILRAIVKASFVALTQLRRMNAAANMSTSIWRWAWY
ncbi:heat shock protein [Teratosphaeria destructans]|uniref:Heat shock protein n=1 Tax=Teratosphaeria destructans TaxID=418781 RepID=A0A9W7SUV5_9PEZI|nr:heat shock protein [Teratosphaeria destructans]